MVKILASRMSSAFARAEKFVVDPVTSSVYVYLPLALLEANARAYQMVFSMCLAYNLFRDLIFYTRMTNHSFLEEVLSSKHPYLIQVTIDVLCSKVFKSDGLKSISFIQLPISTQMLLLFKLPSIYYARWQVNDVLYPWIFNSLTSQSLFKLVDELFLYSLKNFKSFKHCVDTLDQALAFNGTVHVPVHIAYMPDYEAWYRRQITPATTWEKRVALWEFTKVISVLFSGNFTTYKTFTERIKPMLSSNEMSHQAADRLLFVFLNLNNKTSADFYQNLTRSDLETILACFPRESMVSITRPNPACAALFESSPALIPMRKYCSSCFNAVGEQIILQFLQPLMHLLNHKNIVISSKVTNSSEQITRDYIQRLYLHHASKQQYVLAVVDLVLRSNTFEYLLEPGVLRQPTSASSDSSTGEAAAKAISSMSTAYPNYYFYCIFLILLAFI
jgi:hypothetical protein